MRLVEIKIEGWRNINSQSFRPSGKTNLLYGHNGEGKTNFLEAIFAVVSQRYFRTQRIREMLNWGSKTARLYALLEVNGQKRELELCISEKQTIKLDAKEVRRDSTLLEPINSVVFSPEDTKLIRSEPSERRKYIDRVIFALQRSYARDAIEYLRAVRARNSLLKLRRRNEILESYDCVISKKGSEIAQKRFQMTERISAYLNDIKNLITLPEGVRVQYKTKGRDGNSEEEILSKLQSELARDMERGFTTVGPHVDDVQVLVGSREAEKSCSQGQIRAISFALKMTEARMLIDIHGEHPILLLDDIASELDEEKRRELKKILDNLQCQTLISTTEKEQIPWIDGRSDWIVERGEIRVG